MLTRILRAALILLLVSNWGVVKAQQEPQFTQHSFNRLSYNPGYAGLGDAICATGIMRQQWVGFVDVENQNIGPKTYTFSIHSPVKILRGGLGINIMQDQIGFFTHTNVDLGYSYHTSIGVGDLGIGVQAMFFNSLLDFSLFNPINSDDPVLNQRRAEESDMIFDANFGVYYQVPNEFWFGVSAQNLFQSTGRNTLYKLSRTVFLAGGYEINFPTRPFFSIEPSVVIKSDFAIVQMDVNALLKYRDRFWGGLNYRLGDGLGLMFGLWWKDFKLGYSYDISTSKVSVGGSKGSHEILLGYCFKFEFDKGIRTLRNTRYL
ncbi:MAG: type IX secretion system membrane protein PorP/SprF [Bacteroidales bacterium]|nr:type IX secretion system membrane protein PorP/SprF [Bacteroidales bacterium]MDD3010977.1 type IX secretion system membrane protein PorP/SprF [Bacteroidales bacterium]MDD3961115.1 type IX secretion system membrane protein PorP/SprF [Bacteroidales bacterium]MDY0284930.1 type IX secretion system membrane protein PorP/SprF [Bacteroidales bacterium]HPE85904.1 type IX secretion system membrane protein PorP/SprF [Bacteroidales bacterium]